MNYDAWKTQTPEDAALERPRRQPRERELTTWDEADYYEQKCEDDDAC